MISNKKPISVVSLIFITFVLPIIGFAVEPPSGQRTFTNPFGNAAPSPDDLSDELEDAPELDDEEDGGVYIPPSQRDSGSRPDVVGRPSMPPPGGTSSSRSGGANSGSATPAASNNQGSISMGGTTPGGVVSYQNSPTIFIDENSGEGSKELVTDFNFPDADIMDIAKALGKLTGKNFIFDKDVKGRVSVISNSPITVGDAWRAFLTALDMNNFAMIPSGKYIRIARQRDAKDKQLKTYTGDFSPDSDALITRVFTLKYINAEEVVRAFRNFVSTNSRIVAHEQTNTVIVVETGANISKLAKILEILDVEGFDAGIEVISVKFASATELAKLIDSLLPGTTTSAPGRPTSSAASRFAARRTKEGGVINNIIADERTNSMIIHANSRGAAQVRQLVAKLDQKIALSTEGGKLRVVYLQFADAEAIANTLNNIGTTSKSTSNVSSAGGVSTGLNPVANSLFEGNVKVSADKATNSLVVTASPTDFATIQQVIAKLDIPRDEVYVECQILEMNISRDFNWSANLALPSKEGSGLPLLLAPSGNKDLAGFLASPFGQRGAIIPLAGGSSFETTINSQKVKVSTIMGLISALQTYASANLLATPQIMTIDNQEATFETGDQIPIESTTSNGTSVTSSVTKDRAVLRIAITPQINKLAQFVKLTVNVVFEEFVDRDLPASVQGKGKAKVDRSAKTAIYVADGDTAVIGGLTRDVDRQTTAKIPLLGDIPILGWLFSARTTQVTKSNIMVFMTPYIVKQYEKVRMILDKKLKQRDDFVQRQAGGEDPMRPYRDEMIRNLPDQKDLASFSSSGGSRTETIDQPKPVETPEPEATPETPKDTEPTTAPEPISQPESNQAPAPVPDTQTDLDAQAPTGN